MPLPNYIESQAKAACGANAKDGGLQQAIVNHQHIEEDTKSQMFQGGATQKKAALTGRLTDIRSKYLIFQYMYGVWIH